MRLGQFSLTQALSTKLCGRSDSELKVLVVTQYYYPENFRVNDLVATLVSTGHDVEVYTGLPNYPGGRIFGEWKLGFSGSNPRIYRVPIIPRRSAEKIQLVANYLSFLLMGLFGLLFFRSRDFDAVLSLNYSPNSVSLLGYIIGRLKGANHYVWVQDLWPESLIATGVIKDGRLARMVNKAMQWIYRRSAHIFVQSQEFIPALVALGLDASKVSYMPNWAEDIFDQAGQACMEGSCGAVVNSYKEQGYFVFCFAGNLGIGQGLDVFVDVAMRLRPRNIKIVLVGDGRAKAALEQRTHTQNLEETLIFLGPRPLSEMPSLFTAADAMLVSLLPDPALNRTIPGKVQSYMRAGTLIVGAVEGEPARVLREAKQFVAAPGDVEQLHKIMLQVAGLTNMERVARKKEAKRYYNENFEREVVVDKFVNTIWTGAQKIEAD